MDYEFDFAYESIAKNRPTEEQIQIMEKIVMLTEFLTCSLDRIKERILEFKQTRDPETFGLLLLRFDKFALYLCWKFQRKYTFLYDIPLEDLYHTAILGVYKSLISMPDNWRVELLLQRIKSYIRQEFFNWFNDKVALKSRNLETYDLDYREAEAAQDLEDKVNCSMILVGLSEEDRVLIIRKVMENRAYEELRQQYGFVSKQALSKRVCKILKKIRSTVDE